MVGLGISTELAYSSTKKLLPQAGVPRKIHHGNPGSQASGRRPVARLHSRPARSDRRPCPAEPLCQAQSGAAWTTAALNWERVHSPTSYSGTTATTLISNFSRGSVAKADDLHRATRGTVIAEVLPHHPVDGILVLGDVFDEAGDEHDILQSAACRDQDLLELLHGHPSLFAWIVGQMIEFLRPMRVMMIGGRGHRRREQKLPLLTLIAGA